MVKTEMRLEFPFGKSSVFTNIQNFDSNPQFIFFGCLPDRIVKLTSI